MVSSIFLKYSNLNMTTPDITSRQEKSLGLLTAKFVSLLQEAENGVLDIKCVSSDIDLYQVAIFLYNYLNL